MNISGDCAVAVLPNAGLGNKLLVWGRAQVFGLLNEMPALTIGWSRAKIGPILRAERSYRLYGHCMRGNSIAAALRLAGGALLHRTVLEPPVGPIRRSPPGREQGQVYVFRNLPSWKDYFGDIREYRPYIREQFFATVRDRYACGASEHDRPIIAVHVRCGDFRPLRSGENFAECGGVRTPAEYFTTTIEHIRKIHGADLPVTVFSDGEDEDIAFLLAMRNVRRSAAHSDIQDLIGMSSARIILPSAGSTFGEWAAYLSDAVVLRHPDHIHARIRPRDTNTSVYEGPAPARLADYGGLLVSNIRAIEYR